MPSNGIAIFTFLEEFPNEIAYYLYEFRLLADRNGKDIVMGFSLYRIYSSHIRSASNITMGRVITVFIIDKEYLIK